MPAPEEPALGRIRSILNAYQESAALLAAFSLGLFAEIHRQPQAGAEIARNCGTDRRGTERLLEALTAMGVLHRHGATYVLPRDLVGYLVPGQDGDATGMVEMAADLYREYGDLARAVRDGRPLHRLTSDALLSGDPSRVRRYIRSVHTASRESARRVVELAPLLPNSSLLDVAGGSGIFAAEYARRTPGLQATLFDLPPTVEVAREILTQEGLDDRITFRAGDYRHDPFPGPVDAVLLSNVLQTESEEQNRIILNKARESLRTEGTLLVHGVMVEPPHAKPSPTAIFSLMMFALFDHGCAYSADEISTWLAQAGFGVRAVRPIGPPFGSTLIIATRLE